jgi:hypothetical protein
MTDAEARLNALLTAKREAREKPGEPKRCVGCNVIVENPLKLKFRRGEGSSGPWCWECEGP